MTPLRISALLRPLSLGALLVAAAPGVVLAQAPPVADVRPLTSAAPLTGPPPQVPGPRPPAPPAGTSAPEGRAPAPADAPSGGWEAMRTVLALGAVFLLLGIGVRVARRWPGVLRGEAGAGGLQVLGRVALGPKEAVCLVRAGAEVLVVGVGQGGLTLLGRLDAAAAERAAGAAAGRGPQAPPAPWEGSATRGAGAPRLQALVGRVRDVQAAWGIRDLPGGDPR